MTRTLQPPSQPQLCHSARYRAALGVLVTIVASLATIATDSNAPLDEGLSLPEADFVLNTGQPEQELRFRVESYRAHTIDMTVKADATVFPSVCLCPINATETHVRELSLRWVTQSALEMHLVFSVALDCEGAVPCSADFAAIATAQSLTETDANVTLSVSVPRQNLSTNDDDYVAIEPL